MLANRRRIMDEDRKMRILNEKTRTIGIDVNALNIQVKEKLKLKEAERVKELKLDRDTLENDRKALLYQMQEEEERKWIQKKLSNSYVRPKTSGHYGRSNPIEVKLFCKEFPVSSCQQFAGEDPSFEFKEKLKKQSLRQQLDKQLLEIKALQGKTEAENKYWDALAEYQTNLTKNFETEEAQWARKSKIDLQKENKRLARNANQRQTFEHHQEQMKNHSEIFNQLNSEFLTESRLQAKSTQGPGRILPDRWKGMDDYDKTQILKEQERQQRYNALDKQRQLREKAEYDNFVRADVHCWQLGLRNYQLNSKERLKTLAMENQQLALQHKAKMRAVNNAAMNNVPTKDFYNQFGNSVR